MNENEFKFIKCTAFEHEKKERRNNSNDTNIGLKSEQKAKTIK